jgi:photosystem II stability/assembly factor-like uncharacterized protein
MPDRDDLDLLRSSRPAVLDRATIILDEAEAERILHDVLQADPAAGRHLPRPVPTGSRRQLGLGAVAVAVLAVVALVSVPLWSQPRRSTHGLQATGPSLRWRLVSDVSGAWHDLTTITARPDFQVHCASATTCYALGSSVNGVNSGQLIVTTDGGQQWSTVDLPAQLDWNSAMSCINGTTCAILAMESSGQTVFLRTTDGGRSWSKQPGPAGLDSKGGDHTTTVPAIAGLVCPSTGSCTAVAAQSGSTADSMAFATTNGGATWSESTVPVTVDDAEGLNMSPLQCQSNGVCVVAGFVAGSDGESLAAGYSTDGGASWQPATVPTGTYGVVSISCPEVNACLMVSYGGGVGKSTVLETTDGGQAWSALAATGLPQALLTGISCSSSEACWASGRTAGPAFPYGASNSVLALTTDQGQTWQQATLPAGISQVTGVSCPTTGACYALAMRQQKPGDSTFVLLSNASS